MNTCKSKWMPWLLVLLMIPLHLHNCVACMFPGVHRGHGLTYPPAAYGASLLWLAIVLAIDVLLVQKRPFAPARALSWYWALSCALPVLAVLLSEQFIMLYVWAVFLPPVPLLIPLLHVVPRLFSDVYINVMFWLVLFCLIQWALCRLHPRREG